VHVALQAPAPRNAAAVQQRVVEPAHERVPAGVARMPFWRFTILTTLGCIPWIFMLTFIGKQVGDNWESWKDYLHYVDYAVAATIVVFAIYLFVRWRRKRNDPVKASGEPAADAGS
jgi:4-amino-4-deoxy-L-arabinose transferase-like glycosyltransferase